MPAIDDLTFTLMQKPECFADAFNLLLYDGQEVIRPEHLKACDPRHVFYPDSKAERKIPNFHGERDVFRQCEFCKDGISYTLLLGIENQTNVDDFMSGRGMMYEVLALRMQVQIIKEEAREHHELKTSVEIISGSPRDRKLIPVITLIPFFSNRIWDGPRCTHDLLNTDDPAILRFIPNYFINLLIPAEMTMERIGKLRSELRVLFSFLHYSASGGNVKDLLNSDVAGQVISWYTAALIKELLHVDISLPQDKKETTTMCQMMENFAKENYDLGKTDGYDLGKTEVICGLLRAQMDISLIAQVSGVEVEKIREIQRESEGAN